MTTRRTVDTKTLVTVSVTFNPEIAQLERQLRALPADCRKIVVDNASQPWLVEDIRQLAARVANVHVLRNDRNLGLAAAVNLGVQAASTCMPSPEFVLLLDQDSLPQDGSIERLLDAFDELEHAGEVMGCVGPLLRDPQTGLTHGFHQRTRWRWKRVYPSCDSKTPVPCANLNGSGTLLRVALFLELGGLEERFFIDHVDTEWAFRVLAHGYGLWGVPDAVFEHWMGASSIKLWFFGWRLWPVRTPQRHYFLYRNAIALMHRGYVPAVWKVWATIKLLITLAVVLVTGPARRQQLRRIFAAIWGGLKDHALTE